MLAVALHIKCTELVIFSWQLVTVNYKCQIDNNGEKTVGTNCLFVMNYARDIHVYASMSDQ